MQLGIINLKYGYSKYVYKHILDTIYAPNHISRVIT